MLAWTEGAPALPSLSFSARTLLFEHGNQIHPAAWQQGARPKIIPATTEAARAKSKTAQLMDTSVSRSELGHDLQQKPLGANKNSQTSYSAKQRKEHALGEQLSNQAGACGAKRLANSHFASSCASPSEQQIRYVHTADEQDQSYGAKQSRSLSSEINIRIQALCSAG